jgi:Ca-activated chloride channel family protein
MKLKPNVALGIMAAGLILAALTGPSVLAGVVPSSQVQLDAAMNKPLLLAGEKQTAWLRVGLTGFALESPEDRPPVNIAIVIDKSGSMGGEKISKAREAAIMAIQRLNANDIISVVTYDSTVNVLIPATKVADKEAIFQKIRQIGAGGSTALFAGVSKGADEMRKFLSDNRVNRLVLLSDGLANVGPATPAELGSLGTSLIKENISVTTIGLGLGYNEDLMTQLAYNSDGSHYFSENASDLAKAFDSEFGRALSVVAQEVQTHIKCFPGIRPIRLLGRDGDIHGQTVSVFINHLYSKHEKFILLEVEVPAGEMKETRKLAKVTVNYGNLQTKTQDKLSSELEIKFTKDSKMVEQRINGKVMVDVVELLAVEQNELALKLRDQGKVKEAQQVLINNALFLESKAIDLNAPGLSTYGFEQRSDADSMKDEASYKKGRKSMRGSQSKRKQQQ